MTSMNDELDRICDGGNGQPTEAGDTGNRQTPKWDGPTLPLPVPASQLTGGEAVPWLWEGYLAKGYTTLFSGIWKGGKSTMLAHLLKAMGEGGELGGAVAKGRALIVSEEGQGLWSGRRDDLGIGDHCEFICRPFKGRPGDRGWLSFVDHLARLVAERRFGLVVFDTLPSMWCVQDENDAAKVLSALTPLNAITEAGAAVLLVHHPRKGDGGEGMAARGSGALPGFADVILELRRFAPGERADRRRTLTAYSRFDDTPADAVVELTDDGYRSVGSRADARQTDRLAALADMLPTEGPGATVQELRAAWPDGGIPKPGQRTVALDLKAGAVEGRWKASGTGRKGDPLRYSIRAAIESEPARNEYEAPIAPESGQDAIRAGSLPYGARNESDTESPPDPKPGRREPDRDANGETAMGRAARWRREAAEKIQVESP